MHGSEDGNAGRPRGRRERKPRAAAVIAVVALASLAAVACSSRTAERPPSEDQRPGSAPSPEASPIEGPFGQRFDSPLHGLSIGYPSGWRTRAATEPWRGGELAFGAPDVDVIFHPTLRDDLYFAVVSEPLATNSGPDWDDGYLLPSVGICAEPDSGASFFRYTLDGAEGTAQTCGPVAGGHVVTVATATRGYIIYLHVGDERLLRRMLRMPQFQAPYDWDWFEAALETVDLRPEDALDAVNPSESP